MSTDIPTTHFPNINPREKTMFLNLKSIADGLLILPALLLLAALTTTSASAQERALADLRIRDVKFDRANPKLVRVVVGNAGQGTAGASQLRLTVRRIDGTPVGRMTQAKTPPLKFGESAVVIIDATSILPNGVILKDTTFRLDADSDDAVKESNEANNLEWHNL
jgi:hypothetical protein